MEEANNQKEYQKNFPALVEDDSLELLNSIYTQSKNDYKIIRFKRIIRRSFSFLILVLSITGFISILLYFLFLKDHLKDLKKEITKYKEKVTILDNHINTLSIEEIEYKHQAESYKNLFKNLKVEDNRILDFDLTNSVENNLKKIDGIKAEYKNLSRGNTNFKETALTFDLGTGNDVEEIYTILKRFDVKATIFISNETSSLSYGSLFNDRNTQYLKKLGELGCEFGNHTWSHYNLRYSLYETSRRRRLEFLYISDDILDSIKLKLEFERVRDKFYKETGFIMSNFWRAPYGAIDKRVLSIASKAGYPNHVFWSSNKIGALDFYDYVTNRYIWVKDHKTGKIYKKKNPYYLTSQEMLLRMKKWERADKNGLNGAISIAHLGSTRKNDKMVGILPSYISYFKNRGYHFVTMSQIINNKEDY